MTAATAAAPVAVPKVSRPRPRLPEVGPITVVVLALGLLLTGAVTWAAIRAHDTNEARLLEQQAEEATAVLQQAVPAIISRAQEAARIGALLRDDPAALVEELAHDVSEQGRFASITIDRATATDALVTVGAESVLDDRSRQAAAEAAAATPEVVHVTGALSGDDPRIVYTATSPRDPSIVAHAEQRLRPDRIRRSDGEAFDQVHVALYLGDEERADDLLLASTPELPLEGRRAERTIPLGNETMRFVVTPNGTLGGGLLRMFPWLTAVVGLGSTAVGAVLVETLHRRRRDAETFTNELRALYQREHAIAHTLQHSLLPTHLDRLDGVDVAARYFAGAEGTDIGGDWYDVIKHDRGVTVVVGDVVGRGVTAAAVMAAMRYGSHAVAGQGGDPAEVLRAVNGLEHIRGDFVTMLCGHIDLAERTVAFASAGHPPPLLITADDARFLDVPAGPPIGFLDGAHYVDERTAVPPGSVLLLFTDGLYERRGESIEVGLERLRRVARGLTGPVEQTVDRVAKAMLGGGVRDDTAMLAVRVD